MNNNTMTTMNTKTLILALAALAVTAGAADAGTPWIKKRQQHQLNKMGRGVASGALTGGETARAHHMATALRACP